MKMLHATLLPLIIAGFTSASPQIPGVQVASRLPFNPPKCLSVRAWGQTQVDIKNCDPSDILQRWGISQPGPAPVFMGAPVNLCLDPVNVHNSSKVVVKECNRSILQQWRFRNGGPFVPAVNISLCLEVPRISVGITVQVQTAKCNNGLNQLWRVV